MEASGNNYLATRLKNWAVQRQAPASTRQRLLRLAARSRRTRKTVSWRDIPLNTYRPVDWARVMLSWNSAQIFQTGMPASRIMI